MRTVVVLLLLSVGSSTAVAQVSEGLKHREALQHYRAGQQLMTAEKFEKAAEEFQNAIDLDPLVALAHYGLGESYMALKRYASAIRAFTGCKAAYGRLSTIGETNAFKAERNTQEEIGYLRERLIAVSSGQLKGQVPEAQLESRLEELEGKRGKHFEKPETAVPAEVYLSLGSAHYRNNAALDAESNWRMAVTVNPKLGEAHSNLAVLYMQTGRKKEAQASIAAAEKTKFRVNPQLKTDINNMP